MSDDECQRTGPRAMRIRENLLNERRVLLDLHAAQPIDGFPAWERQHKWSGLMDVHFHSANVAPEYHGPFLMLSFTTVCGAVLRYRLPATDAARIIQALSSDHAHALDQSPMSSGMPSPSAEPNDGHAPNPLANSCAADPGFGWTSSASDPNQICHRPSFVGRMTNVPRRVLQKYAVMGLSWVRVRKRTLAGFGTATPNAATPGRAA